MRRGLVTGPYWVTLGLLFGAGCSDAPAESTIEQPKRGGSGDAGEEDNVVFDSDLQGDDCCDHFCTTSIEAGCREYGDTKEACVIALCPVPGGLEPYEASQCRKAQAEAVCCSWRQIGADGCAIVDPHGSAECGSEATAADDACVAP